MANKSKQHNEELAGRIYVKFVKRANMHCETSFDSTGKQIQRWF
jgi:hypothetical protein